MDLDLRTLTDVPDATALDGDQPRSRIAVAKLGNFSDKRYGEFAIGSDDFDGWQRNLTGQFGGRIAIDYDHSPEKGKGTKAAAWITGLALEGDKVIADVEWTPAGAQSVRDGEYRYISPTFVGNYRDEQGKPIGRALIGAGLTNRPFLRRDMPALNLSRDDGEFAAEQGSDSRRSQMAPLPNIAIALGLDATADEARILDHVQGKVILDSGEHASLLAKATERDTLAADAAKSRFDTTWTKTLDRGAVTPAQLDDFTKLYALDADTAIRTLDALQPVVSTRPRGEGTKATETPDGVDPERQELHERATALSREKGIDYVDAVHILNAETLED